MSDKQNWDHLPEWRNKDATDYFRGKGRKEFSYAYLEERDWILKHSNAKAAMIRRLDS